MGINKNPHILLLFCLLLPCILEGIHAVQYIVANHARNHPGGIRFDREIGVNYTLRRMSSINRFIWDLFEQHSPSERKNVSVVKVFISDFSNRNIFSKVIISNSSNHTSYTVGNTININAVALEKYPSEKKPHFFFTSILHHEMTHVFQWTGNDTAPRGLIEGIADYVMVKAYYYSSPYTKRGEGENWDEGFGVTERFLEYCDSLRNGFTVSLNKRMRNAYSDDYFGVLLGKPVHQLWAEYKAAYHNM